MSSLYICIVTSIVSWSSTSSIHRYVQFLSLTILSVRSGDDRDRMMVVHAPDNIKFAQVSLDGTFFYLYVRFFCLTKGLIEFSDSIPILRIHIDEYT